LAGIGILDLAANRGAVLRAFGPRQLREICHVRRVLEAEAARCACGRIARFELEALAREFRRLSGAERSQAWSADTLRFDTQLHELIAERCGNQRLAHEISRYRALHRTLREVRHARRRAQADYGSMDENAEHLSIVEALLAGDGTAAAEAMTRHIDRAADMLEQDLFEPQQIQQDQAEPFLREPSLDRDVARRSNGSGERVTRKRK
jgi:DNA-binding GntR family transcriptional regulator